MVDVSPTVPVPKALFNQGDNRGSLTLPQTLALLAAMLPGEDGEHELVLGRRRVYVELDRRERLELYVRGGLQAHHDIWMSAVPRKGERPGFPGLAGSVWAHGDTRRFQKLLEEFEPRPTLVLEEPSLPGRTAFWAISNPLDYGWTRKANRRLAKWLAGSMRAAEPEWLVPLTLRTVGLVHDEPIYTAAEVVKRLPDPSSGRWKGR